MMIGKLSILDRDGEEVCIHTFNMAGSNTTRVLEYATKTCRRRWVRVEWFKSMAVWVSVTGELDYKLLAEIKVNEPTLDIEENIL